MEADIILVFSLHSIVHLGRDAVLEAADQILVCEDVIPKQLRGAVLEKHASDGLDFTEPASTVQPLDEALECAGVIFGKFEVSGLRLPEAIREDPVEEQPSFCPGQGFLVNEVQDLVGPNRDGDNWGAEDGGAMHGDQYETPNWGNSPTH